jgi:hypothetical protein
LADEEKRRARHASVVKSQAEPVLFAPPRYDARVIFRVSAFWQLVA